jgi:hypothetical protein
MFKIYFKNKGCTRKLSITNRLNCEPCALTPEFWSAQEGQLVCFIDPVHEDKKYWKANMQIIDSKKIKYQTYTLSDGQRMVSGYWSPVAYLELAKYQSFFTERVNVGLHDVRNSPAAHEAWEHLCAIPHIFRAAVDEFHEWFPNTNNVNKQ